MTSSDLRKRLLPPRWQPAACWQARRVPRYMCSVPVTPMAMRYLRHPPRHRVQASRSRRWLLQHGRWQAPCMASAFPISPGAAGTGYQHRAAGRQLCSHQPSNSRRATSSISPSPTSHGDPPRSVRPAHRALSRFSQPGAGVRRHAEGSSASTWVERDLLLQPSPSPAPILPLATWRPPSTCRWDARQIYVTPAQDGTTIAGYTRLPTTTVTAPPATTSPTRSNSARWTNFHDASESVQPLPFAEMKDTYATLTAADTPTPSIRAPCRRRRSMAQRQQR